MTKTTVLTIYVDQTNGNDSNNGNHGSPFKTLQKAIDTVPIDGNADIHILGDYALTSNVIISSKTNVTLILHGTLTTTEYTPPTHVNHTGIYTINVVNSSVHVVIDSDNNGKIVVPTKSSSNPVAQHRYAIFNGSSHSNFTDIKFDLRVKQDDYNPIVINSGFGLVSIIEWNSDKTKLNVKVTGHYSGKNRNIIVDSNSTLVSFENAIGNFYYDYAGGLTNETNTSISVSKCIDGYDYKVKVSK